MRQLIWLLPLAFFACVSCSNNKKTGRVVFYNDTVETDSLRKAYDGFEWNKISGAGFKLMVQRSDDMRLLIDPQIPGVVIVRNGDKAPHCVIRLFRLKNKSINDIIDVLKETEGWDDSQTCRLEEVVSERIGVSRYVMLPDADYAAMIDSVGKCEPVSSTCNGWGIGNSGMRYFEIYDNSPDKAVFVEIGQEAPLFDENSIELCDVKTDATISKDILYTMEGELRIAHEVRSFKPSDSEGEFWIVDKTGQLEDMYDKITKGQKNGKPVKATLKLEYNGKWDDGFAEDYDGVYFVREVVDLNIR